MKLTGLSGGRGRSVAYVFFPGVMMRRDVQLTPGVVTVVGSWVILEEVLGGRE